MIDEKIIEKNAQWEIKQSDNTISALEREGDILNESLREFEDYVRIVFESYIRGDISDGHFSEIKRRAEELRKKFNELSNVLTEYRSQKQYHEAVLRYALSVEESREEYTKLKVDVGEKYANENLAIVELGNLEHYARQIGESAECKQFLNGLEPGLGDRFNFCKPVNHVN
ncbi:hypothetical protein ACFL1Z_03050 [Thermodesulfobacteriota bacterium]